MRAKILFAANGAVTPSEEVYIKPFDVKGTAEVRQKD
jgi:hypothetical protein